MLPICYCNFFSICMKKRARGVIHTRDVKVAPVCYQNQVFDRVVIINVKLCIININ